MAKKPDKPIDMETTGRAMAVRESEFTPENKTLLVRLAESLMESQYSHAVKCPRDVRRAQDSMHYMATMDEEAAAEMHYALPRGGKAIEGPSIRFAEVVIQSWGNCRSDARVIETNRVEKYIEAEGAFLDLETNVGHTSHVRIRIFDREGRLYNDDQIMVTGNAACAKAKRNAILAGIPKAAWRAAYEASRAPASSTSENLSQKRRDTLTAFTRFNVSPDRVLASIGLRSEAELTPNHISTLRGMWAALKNGEATTEEMFATTQAEISDSSKKAKKATLDDLAKGDDEDTKNLEARKKEISDTHDAGLMGFHKGLDSVPIKYARDVELTQAWLEGWQEAKDASGEEEEDV